MNPEFLQSLVDLDLPEDLKARLAALGNTKSFPYRDELVSRLSLPRTFTSSLYQAAARSLGVDPPPFEKFTELSEVEPLASRSDRFTIQNKTRELNLKNHFARGDWRTWGIQCAGLLNAGDEVESMDRLQVLLLADTANGASEVRAAFEAADSAGDIPKCGALVQLLAAVTPIVPETDPLFRELQARYRSRSLFQAEFLQSASFFPRREIESELNSFAEEKGSSKWIYHLHATGGMGKTTLLRRMISRNWIIGVQRHPCAWIDLDYLEVQSILEAPALLAILIAAQLNEQLEQRVFSSLLSTTVQSLTPLVFRADSYGGALGIAGAAGDVARTGYEGGRSNPMRCGILAGAVPLSSPESRSQLLFSARSLPTIWDIMLPNSLAALPRDRSVLLMIDTLEEASLHHSTRLRETLLHIRDLRNKVLTASGVEIKLILSGRNELGTEGHVPAFREEFKDQFIIRPLPGLEDKESEEFLEQRLKGQQHKLIPAMISKSEKSPFNLSLFAEWASEDPDLTADTILQSEQITTVMLIERIVKRIPYQPLRWIIRYGSVPRLLTIDFLEHVMRQPLIDALSGKAKLTGVDDPGSKVEIDIWKEEKDFVFDAETLWRDHVSRYASVKGWMEPVGEAVRFRADIQNPMRVLLRRQPIFRDLHRAAAKRFAEKANDEHNQQRLTARIEWFYHALQLRNLEGGTGPQLIEDLTSLFDSPALIANATTRRETANTLLTADFDGWQRREQVYIEYRLAEAIAAENGYRYISVPAAKDALLKVFETAKGESFDLPPFAHLWKQAADGASVSSFLSENDEDGQLAMLIVDMAGARGVIAREALRKALSGFRGDIVPRGWLLERLAEHYRGTEPLHAIDNYMMAAADFESRGETTKASDLLAEAARVEISLQRLTRAERILQPLDVVTRRTTAVSLQLARVELMKGQPGEALEILRSLSSQNLDQVSQLEISRLRADALSQRVLWAEAQQEWESALYAATSLSKQGTAAQCIVGMVKLGAWWLRRTDHGALAVLTERAESSSVSLLSPELEVWRIALREDEQVRRRALSAVQGRTSLQRLRLLLTLARYGLAERYWGLLLESANAVHPPARIAASMEPALFGDRPPDVPQNFRRSLAEALTYQPEGEIESAWYAIRHGELLAWLGFHEEAVALLSRNIPVLHPGVSVVEAWRVAVYRERRRVEQRIRNWGGTVDAAPDPPELWLRLWSHTPFRQAAALVENAQRAHDARDFKLASECLRLAEPALRETPFETDFHRTNKTLRAELDGSRILDQIVLESKSPRDAPYEIIGLRADSGNLVARWRDTDTQIFSDTDVQDLLLRTRGIPNRLAKLDPPELKNQLREILMHALGDGWNQKRVGLQMPFGPLSATPWELAFDQTPQPFRSPSGTGEFRRSLEDGPDRPSGIACFFQLSHQMKESRSIPAYFDLANRLKADGSLPEVLSRFIPGGLSVLYVACAFEELTTLSEPVIAGTEFTGPRFTQHLERLTARTHPVVILDVPAMHTPSDEIQQMLLRNYFAQSLLDGGMVTCVLATGLRPLEAIRDVHRRLIPALEQPSESQGDLLDEIARTGPEPPYGDALFTRNPRRLLAGIGARAYA